MVQMNKGSIGLKSGCCNGLSALLSPKLFKALSDSKRVSLFVRLAEERKPCTVSYLAEGSGVDVSVVSRHLAALRDAGVISCIKQGKEVWCAVNKDAVVKMLRGLADALETCCSSVPVEKAVATEAQASRKSKRTL
jgi:DNA-binding transcriptional ArsR family regulator